MAKFLIKVAKKCGLLKYITFSNKNVMATFGATLMNIGLLLFFHLVTLQIVLLKHWWEKQVPESRSDFSKVYSAGRDRCLVDFVTSVTIVFDLL